MPLVRRPVSCPGPGSNAGPLTRTSCWALGRKAQGPWSWGSGVAPVGKWEAAERRMEKEMECYEQHARQRARA